jgi:site-specific DNA-methyltransferase (adenine-specific)
MSAHEKPSEHVDWLTPQWIFDALDVRFGLDPAASASEHNVVPMTDTGVKHVGAGGTDKAWPKQFVWLNPPYGRVCSPFMHRMVEHSRRGGSGIALLPVRTDTGWWAEGPGQLATDPAQSSAVFLRGRVQFVHGDTGQPGPSPAFPSVLVAWGDQGRDALNWADLPGMWVNL